VSRPAVVIRTLATSIILPLARIFSTVRITRPRLTSPLIVAPLKPCATKNGRVAPLWPGGASMASARRCSALSVIGPATVPAAELEPSLSLPPFAIAPFDSVEELSGLFSGKHHADITGWNPRCALLVKFVAVDKRHTIFEGVIRNTNAGADQRGRLDDDAVQSTVSVVREPPKRHLARVHLGPTEGTATTGRRIVKPGFGKVTAAHSPEDLSSVRVLFKRSFIEAFNCDIEVKPRNLQFLALLSHVTPMTARRRRGSQGDDECLQHNTVTAISHRNAPLAIEGGARQGDIGSWLNGMAGAELLRPAADDRLRVWPVSRRANKTGSRDDDRTLIDKVMV
jgi:hypothetical protein